MVINLDATHLGFSPFQTGLYQVTKNSLFFCYSYNIYSFPSFPNISIIPSPLSSFYFCTIPAYIPLFPRGVSLPSSLIASTITPIYFLFLAPPSPPYSCIHVSLYPYYHPHLSQTFSPRLTRSYPFPTSPCPSSYHSSTIAKWPGHPHHTIHCQSVYPPLNADPFSLPCPLSTVPNPIPISFSCIIVVFPDSSLLPLMRSPR